MADFNDIAMKIVVEAQQANRSLEETASKLIKVQGSTKAVIESFRDASGQVSKRLVASWETLNSEGQVVVNTLRLVEGGINKLSSTIKQASSLKLLEGARGAQLFQGLEGQETTRRKELADLKEHIQNKVKAEQQLAKLVQDARLLGMQRVAQQEETTRRKELQQLRQHIEEKAKTEQQLAKLVQDARLLGMQRVAQQEETTRRKELQQLRQHIEEKHSEEQRILRLISEARESNNRRILSEDEAVRRRELQRLRQHIQEKYEEERRIAKLLQEARAENARRSAQQEEIINRRELQRLRQHIEDKYEEEQRLGRLIADARVSNSRRILQEEESARRRELQRLRQHIEEKYELERRNAQRIADAQLENSRRIAREREDARRRELGRLREDILARNQATSQPGFGQRLGAGAKNVGKAIGYSLAIGAVFELQHAFREGTRAAIDFNKAIAEISTIDVDRLGFGTWTKQLRELSDAFGIEAIDQAEAAYQALSNQVVTGAQAFDFLTAANRLAIAAVTDTSTAVNTLSSVLNAYNMDVTEAERVSAILFKTVELGRVRLPEMASSLGKIALPARQVGIGFEELSAAIATLTVQGVKFNEASTFLRNIVQKMIRPTGALQAVFEDMGFSSAEAANKVLGFGGVLAELQRRTQGSATEIGNLFQRIRAIGGVLGFTGPALKKFEDNLRKISVESAETFDSAVQTVLNSTGQRLEKEFERLRNFFKVDVGLKFIDIVADLADSVGGLANLMRHTLAAAIGVAAGAMVAYTTSTLLAARATVGLGVAIKSLLTSTGIGLLAVALGYFVGQLVISATTSESTADQIVNDAERIKKSIQEVSKERREANAKIAKDQKAVLDELEKQFIESQRGIRQQIAETQRVSIKASEASRKRLLDDLKVIEKKSKETLTAVVNSVKTLEAQFKSVGQAAKATLGEVFELRFQTTGEFDSPSATIDQARAFVEEFKSLAQSEFAQIGTPGFSAESFNEAIKLQKRFIGESFRLESAKRQQEAKIRMEVFRLEEEAEKARKDHDRERQKLIKKQIKELQDKENLRLKTSSKMLDIELKIFDAEAELAKLRNRGSFADRKAAKDKIKALKREKAVLDNLEEQAVVAANNRIKEVHDVFKFQKEAAEKLARLKEQARKKELAENIEADLLADAIKKFRDFNLASVFNLDDPKAIEAALKTHLKVLENISAGQKRLGLTFIDDINKERKNLLAQASVEQQSQALKSEESAHRAMLNLERAQVDELKKINDERIKSIDLLLEELRLAESSLFKGRTRKELLTPSGAKELGNLATANREFVEAIDALSQDDLNLEDFVKEARELVRALDRLDFKALGEFEQGSELESVRKLFDKLRGKEFVSEINKLRDIQLEADAKSRPSIIGIPPEIQKQIDASEKLEETIQELRDSIEKSITESKAARGVIESPIKDDKITLQATQAVKKVEEQRRVAERKKRRPTPNADAITSANIRRIRHRADMLPGRLAYQDAQIAAMRREEEARKRGFSSIRPTRQEVFNEAMRREAQRNVNNTVNVEVTVNEALPTDSNTLGRVLQEHISKGIDRGVIKLPSERGRR
jgi:TP901 family phage tail tape measure protein